MSVAPFLVAVWLLLVGVYGVVTSRHLVHLVICVAVATPELLPPSWNLIAFGTVLLFSRRAKQHKRSAGVEQARA